VCIVFAITVGLRACWSVDCDRMLKPRGVSRRWSMLNIIAVNFMGTTESGFSIHDNSI
jgi:hypothetical protein